jgi:hypothetical protein
MSRVTGLAVLARGNGADEAASRVALAGSIELIRPWQHPCVAYASAFCVVRYSGALGKVYSCTITYYVLSAQSFQLGTYPVEEERRMPLDYMNFR